MKVLGIDPGGHVGIAVLDDGKLVAARTFDWRKKWRECLDYIDAEIGAGAKRVVIENPEGTSFPRGLSPRKELRIAKNIGQLIERYRHIVAHCEMHDAEVISRKPIRGGTKWPRAQWDAAFPEWGTRKISEHARDAATLAKLTSYNASVQKGK